MPSISIIGTIAISISTGEEAHAIASLLSASIRVSSDLKEMHDPDGGTWQLLSPDQLEWRADATEIQLVNTDSGVREAYLYQIEAMCINREIIDVEIESPTGATYTSRGYIDSFELGAGFDDVFSGSFGIQGIEELVLVEPDGEGE